MVITDQTIELGTGFLIALGGVIYKLTDLATKVELLIKGHAQNTAQIHQNALAIQAQPSAPAVTIMTSGAQTPPKGEGTDA